MRELSYDLLINIDSTGDYKVDSTKDYKVAQLWAEQKKCSYRTVITEIAPEISKTMADWNAKRIAKLKAM